MTVSAHNNRRVWGGASLARNVDGGTEQRVRLYRMLHPEMFSKAAPKRKARTPTGQRAYDWLVANGPHTGRQIAEGLDLHPETIHSVMAHGVVGVEQVDTIRDKDGRKIKVWGIVEGGDEITTS